jgi:hypothetical protein
VMHAGRASTTTDENGCQSAYGADERAAKRPNHSGLFEPAYEYGPDADEAQPTVASR